MTIPITTQPTQTMLPVYVLAFSAFIFNTSEFLPIALLSDIGASFAMTADEVGVMMTIYAWVVALCSLPMMLLTAKIERKKLLFLVFMLFIVAHGFSFWSKSFWFLVGSRVLVAIAHAVFWSITASLAVRLAPANKKTKALGLLATGGALAMVAGLPLGRVLGQMMSWQASFGIIGVVGLVILGFLLWLLPILPAQNTGNLSSLPKLIKNNALMAVYLIIALMITAHFTAYSYIEPFVLQVAGFGGNFATMVLLIFGLAGLVASALFAKYYDKTVGWFEWIGFVLMVLALSLLLLLSKVVWLWTFVAFIWGVCMTCLALALQLRVLKLAPNDSDVAMSIFSGIFNVGIGGGALVGGVVIVQFGLSFIGVVAACVLFLAAMVFGLAFGSKGWSKTS